MNALLLSLFLACAAQNSAPQATTPELPTAEAPPTEVAPTPEPAAEPEPSADPEPAAEPAPQPTQDPAPPPATATNGAAGAACQTHTECVSGICEGEGCGEATPGKCAPAQRSCTRDLRQYCGCDGETFATSGSCPNNRFAHKGPCAP